MQDEYRETNTLEKYGYPGTSTWGLLTRDRMTVAEMIAHAFVTFGTEKPSRRLQQSYAALIHANRLLFAALPVSVEPVADLEPYDSALAMRDEVVATGVIRVNNLANNHPLLTAQDNLEFRAVHDYWGHVVGSAVRPGAYDFTLEGEVNAYKLHTLVYPVTALPALFSEVVGQSCYFDVHGEFQEHQTVAWIPGFGDFRDPTTIDVDAWLAAFPRQVELASDTREFCTNCGVEVPRGQRWWLEMDRRSATLHNVGEVPPEHSQRCFCYCEHHAHVAKLYSATSEVHHGEGTGTTNRPQAVYNERHHTENER